MQIKIAKQSGFCFGVKRAVDATKNALCSGDTVYCLGQLIHNKTVTDLLQKDGLIVVDDIRQVPNGSTVIFRSHGEPKSVHQIAQAKHLKVVDCTCPFVSKIHKITKRHYDDGYKIIIIGKATHPEVIGINGWCDNSGVVVESADAELVLDKGTKYCVVSQTTNSQELWQSIKKNITNFNANIVAFFDTICYTTSVRQVEARSVAMQCDTMLVLGNANSANAKQLMSICEQYCSNSFMLDSVQQLLQLDKRMLLATNNVGITAGASTPYELVEQIVECLVRDFCVSPKLL